ncbi:MAG: hypothetical protein EZS28_018548 [Streblomastix strix]|uniref:Uncharacterized protein n=1 Tax=Streblomastix strix TaxID=222440 RepID=A0A5J4VU22_9EUKA|nr:MAG: hypothetical protein EZS28_018548 [Streblomastix strix]
MDDDYVPYTQRKGDTILFTVQSTAERLNSRSKEVRNFDYRDVEGTVAKPIQVFNRPPMDYDTIEGTHSIKQTKDRQFILDGTLNIADIEGTQSKSKAFSTTRRVNPLTPVYKLPEVVERPLTPPHFIKDTLDHSDIPNSFPKPIFDKSKAAHTTQLNVMDITAAIVQKGHLPTKIRDQIGCMDINAKQYILRTATNPLEPEYIQAPSHLKVTLPCFEPSIAEKTQIQNGESPSEIIGLISKSHPRITRRALENAPIYNLETIDVDGATNQFFQERAKHTQIHPITDISDIEGAQSSTAKRVSMRSVNPVDPDYSQSLMTIDRREQLRDVENEEHRIKNEKFAEKLLSPMNRQNLNPITWREPEHHKPDKRTIHKVTVGYDGRTILEEQARGSEFFLEGSLGDTVLKQNAEMRAIRSNIGVEERGFEDTNAMRTATLDMKPAGEIKAKARENAVGPQILSKEQKEQVRSRDMQARMARAAQLALGSNKQQSSHPHQGQGKEQTYNLSVESAEHYGERIIGISQSTQGKGSNAQKVGIGGTSGTVQRTTKSRTEQPNRSAEQLKDDIRTIRALK